MGFNCGIVGLPNVGKSTLFNALTSTQAAQAANYPFCTIEPNIGRVAVPDPRLDVLTKLSESKQTIFTQLEFVDIAGLVRGASRGEGLGNQFLASIREVDAIVHVLRCFEDTDITHVEGSIDPVRDAQTIETELMLADLDSLERRIVPFEKKAKSGEKDAKVVYGVMKDVLDALNAGKPARVVSAAIEAEVAQLTDPAEQKDFLETLGLSETGLNRVIAAGYKLLAREPRFLTKPNGSPRKVTSTWPRGAETETASRRK